MSYYQRIRDLREDSDKTQTDIAKYLGTTAQYYGKYEKGERQMPFERAIELSNYYHVSLDYLAGKTNIKNIQSDIFNIDEDELSLLKKYRTLSERNKGKIELFIDQLVGKTSSNNSSTI